MALNTQISRRRFIQTGLILFLVLGACALQAQAQKSLSVSQDNKIVPGHAPFRPEPQPINGGGLGRGVRPQTYGAIGDGVADDGAALGSACLAASAAGAPVALSSGTYRVAASRSLDCDVAFSAGASIAPDAGQTVTITGAIKGKPTQQIFRGAGRVVAAGAPWVSVAWWGALAAATAGIDAMPAIRSAFGANRTIYFPPATYTCKSTTPSSYPLVSGSQCLDFYDADNWVIEGDGAVIVADNNNNKSALIGIDYANHFHVRGLALQGNPTGLPQDSEVAAFFLAHISDFSFENLSFPGNWGGSTRQPFAFAGDWLTDGTFTRLQMPAVGGCFDFAFLNHVSFTHIRAVGAADDGTTTAASRVPCINIEDDYNFRNAYPNAVAFSKTTGVTIAQNDMSNFVAAVFLRAGSGYNIVGNNFHDNPGSDNSIIGTDSGAGVMIFYTDPGCCSSNADPVADVTITGNLIKNNGATVAGGGVMIDTRAFPLSVLSSGTIGAAGAGYKAGDILSCSGGVQTRSIIPSPCRIKVDTVNGGAVQTWHIWHTGSYSTAPNNPVRFSGGAGTGFTLNASWATPAKTRNIAINNNVFDGNNNQAIKTVSAAGLGPITAAGNCFHTGAFQTNKADANTALVCGTHCEGIPPATAPRTQRGPPANSPR
jgi:hypothetical protein